MAGEQEFKFPDEVQHNSDNKEPEEKLEIEVVDDTPAEDKGREPMKEPPAEVTDDELAQYSEGVKKRIQHFTKGYHDERRAREAAEREREAAVQLAQKVAEENKRLQGSLSTGQAALLDQAKKVVEAEVDTAKRAYRAAYEAGDGDALVAAQEALTAAKIKADRLNNFKPTPSQAPKNEVQPRPTVAQPAQQAVPDRKAQAWRDANPWFGSDDEMTALALAVHKKLVAQNVDTTSDEYYNAINTRMKEKFPEAYSDASTSEKPTGKSVRTSTVVAPATRSTAPRKIVLTQSQVNIAKRLGVPLEAYAKQIANDMRKNNG